MNVAIVVFSNTGNSATVARAIAATLRERGHDADVHMLRPTGKVTPASRTVSFSTTPDISGADALVLGGPVWAFQASPPLRSYAASLASLKNKKAALFVTHGLPLPFSGKGRAFSVLGKRLRDSGATVVACESILCFKRPKVRRMNAVAATIAEQLDRTT